MSLSQWDRFFFILLSSCNFFFFLINSVNSGCDETNREVNFYWKCFCCCSTHTFRSILSTPYLLIRFPALSRLICLWENFNENRFFWAKRHSIHTWEYLIVAHCRRMNISKCGITRYFQLNHFHSTHMTTTPPLVNLGLGLFNLIIFLFFIAKK